AQREKVDTLYSLSGQANAVFDQKPRPSLLQDARQAFETMFPQAPRPVDLNRLYVNAYREKQDPPGSAQFTREWVSSRSVADLIAQRYSGGDRIDLGHDSDRNISYGVFSSPDAVSDEAKVGGTTAQAAETFINGFSADTAESVKAQNDQYFSTPGPDGKTPLQKLGELRKNQIQADAQLQHADGTLSPKALNLVESVTQYPTQADLDRAYPDESARPRVFSVSINPDSNANGKRDGDQRLYGPLVMMTPRADDWPGKNDVVVLSLPGQGLKAFDSVEAMKSYVAEPGVQVDAEQRHALLNFLPEQEQADFAQNRRYELGGFQAVPAGTNFFEHGVQQQIDKQGRDTEYRMTQAGKRGADLTEFDEIAADSSDDLRESFDADGMLTERDIRLIEHNRPDWWKQSSQVDRDSLENFQEGADQFENNLDELESQIPTLMEHAATKIREELQSKYPGIDPDKVAVAITYYQPPEGATRVNPDPQPQSKTITTTLTEYVTLKRQLARNPPDDETGVSGTLLDALLPGTDVAKLFRENKVGVSATMAGADGKQVTLAKEELNVLAEKLDVGQSYDQLLTDKYGDRKLKETWQGAYGLRMLADAKEGDLSGAFGDLYQNKLPYRMVREVIKNSDSSKRGKVDGYTIQTEAFTVDIHRPGRKDVIGSYPVNGMVVIGAVDSRGNESRAMGTVVLYTPDAPDGRAYRTYA
ncbi:dermonecrotic toxin domain-containing protein, partial [Burkholderia lata]|uniref:dermonecrotic toxin domain-containing protein n=1 Tax=Burkholderia lata (strain ATCC 17760 / DSM 23089 / LMG 22485 / NCIMB 9086 / R18194 / 383) TaxID=482957 RepID=UPI001581E22C